MRNLLKTIIHWSKLFFTPLALGFIGYFFWQSRGLLSEIFKNANVGWLSASVILWSLLHFTFPVFTKIILKTYAVSLGYKKALWIHVKRMPAKYLPGGIWHTVARASDYRQQGLETRGIAIYFFIENISLAAVTLALGGCVVIPLLNNEIWQYSVAVLIFSSTLVLIGLPGVLKKNTFSLNQALLTSHYYLSILCLFFYWIIAASAFVCFLKAFPHAISSVSPIISGGIYIFSWGIGFIALFSPQGIGVTEYISGQLLDANIAKHTFIALLASFRIIIFIGDLLAYLFLIILKPIIKL